MMKRHYRLSAIINQVEINFQLRPSIRIIKCPSVRPHAFRRCDFAVCSYTPSRTLHPFAS